MCATHGEELMEASLRTARVLHVRLHGGHYMYGPQKADFQFLCDRDVDEVRSSRLSRADMVVF